MVRNTYSLDLQFLSPYPLKKGGSPSHAIAHVSVKRSHSPKDGPPLITPQCVTLAELEYQIDRLKEELEEIRKAAKKSFALHDKREKEWCAEYRKPSG
jgi:hypothetical protein